MAATPQQPVLDLMKGTDKFRDHSYDIQSKGLIVIGTVKYLDYKYTTGGKSIHCNTQFKGIKDLAKASVDELKKALKWKEGDTNLVELKNIVRDKDFSSVRKEIWNQWKEMEKEKNGPPSFLMFFLMAPGFEDGQFLLNYSPIDSDTCEGDHALKDKCYSRRISDLVRAIQEAEDDGKRFTGIPKIFFIHTVSGSKEVKKEPKGEKWEPIDADKYIPRGSDTFVFHVHSKVEVEWLTARESSFFLIKEFCRQVAQLENNVRRCDEWLRDFQTVWPDIDVPEEKPSSGTHPPSVRSSFRAPAVNAKLLKSINDHIDKKLKLNLELNGNSLTGGWFDNLCTTLVAEITNSLAMEGEKEGNIHKYDDMRARLSSTFRYRLSVLDIIQQQSK